MSNLVSVQVLTWNNYNDTKKLLLSSRNLNYDNFKVTVVDNHSKDDSIKRLKSEFPDYEYLINSENQKYSGGTNFGIKNSSYNDSKYLFLLNNDTEIVDPETLNKLTSILDNYPEIVVVGCRAVYPDGSAQTDAAKLFFPGILNFILRESLPAVVIHKIRNKLRRNNKDSKLFKIVDWVPTGVTLFRKEVFNKVIFNNDFPMEFSDVEFCKRVRVSFGGGVALSNVKIVHTNNFPSHIEKSIKNFLRAKRAEFLYIKLYNHHAYYLLYKFFVFTNSLLLLVILSPLSIKNTNNRMRLLNYFNLLKGF